VQVRSADGRASDFVVQVDPDATTRRVVQLPSR
jgi:hypothetical protein